MYSISKIVFLLFIVVLLSVAIQSEKRDYQSIIDMYLQGKKIKPTEIWNSYDGSEISLLNHEITWRSLGKGIEVLVDGDVIITSDKITKNVLWDSGVDSVNFANSLIEVKVYEELYLIGFVFMNSPCSGLACSVNYQLIYNWKTKKQNYFGRFRTGFELELYDFNSDNLPDYLSKSFYGRNKVRIDTTEFVMYSQVKNENFEIFQNENQNKFWFKHVYSEFHYDLKNEGFTENWFERISP